MAYQSVSILCVIVIVNSIVNGDIPQNDTSARQRRLLPLFQIIRFQNDNCAGSSSSKSGTCYTSEECKAKGGSSSGTCASGYGVCCIFNQNCGSESSENCTYLTQPTSTSFPSSCVYSICKCSSDVCRIRFDLTMFSISDPVVGTVDNLITNAGAIGDCTTDQFSVTAPNSVGSPVICGFNTGQHLIVDASDECHKAAFTLSGTTATRSWDIKVTQFKCSENQGGPDGCLQYFTGTSGTISSFNFPTASSSVTSTATHLSNQCYNICIRRESGRCAICYVPNFADAIAGAILSTQVAFGLSITSAIDLHSATGTTCTSDYILIPGAQDLVGPDTALPIVVAMIGSEEGRICGRVLSAVTAKALTDAYDTTDAAMQISVCSQVTPFVITFKTDANEIETGTDTMTAEVMTPPGGIIGFSLNYQQVSC